MKDRTHLPFNSDKRPHVPIEKITIGELFRQYDAGDVIPASRQDQDYLALQRAEEKRKNKPRPAPVPAP